MNVRFCRSCKSLILTEVRFCPYCGTEADKGLELRKALDAPFERLDRAQASGGAGSAAGPFAQAEESLLRLESDMDLILEELKKEGRSSSWEKKDKS